MKLLYALLITSRKLKHYFQAHPIEVQTSFALGTVLHNREAEGKIVKWAVKLGQYTIMFAPRSAIKGQTLAEFVAEWTEIQNPPAAQDIEYWKMYFDGSLQLQGAGIGVVFISPTGERL